MNVEAEKQIEMYHQFIDDAHIRAIAISSAKKGYALSEARVQKLVDAVDRFLIINSTLPVKASWYSDLLIAFAEYKAKGE